MAEFFNDMFIKGPAELGLAPAAGPAAAEGATLAGGAGAAGGAMAAFQPLVSALGPIGAAITLFSVMNSLFGKKDGPSYEDRVAERDRNVGAETSARDSAVTSGRQSLPIAQENATNLKEYQSYISAHPEILNNPDPKIQSEISMLNDALQKRDSAFSMPNTNYDVSGTVQGSERWEQRVQQPLVRLLNMLNIPHSPSSYESEAGLGQGNLSNMSMNQLNTIGQPVAPSAQSPTLSGLGSNKAVAGSTISPAPNQPTGQNAPAQGNQQNILSKLFGGATSGVGGLLSSLFGGSPSGINTGDQQSGGMINQLMGLFGNQQPPPQGQPPQSQSSSSPLDFGSMGLGLGITGLGELLGKRTEFPSLETGDVKALRGFDPMAYSQQMDPNLEAAINRAMDLENEQNSRNLRDVYKNARPGTDYTTDSAYIRDLANMQRNNQFNRSDALAKGQLDSNAQRIQAGGQNVGKLGQSAEMSLYEPLGRTGLEAQENKQQKDIFSGIGSMFLSKGLWPQSAANPLSAFQLGQPK